MSYCSSAEVQLAWAGITETEAVAERITLAIETADSIINTHIGAHYTVPLSVPPKVVKWWSVNISVFNLKSYKDPRLVVKNAGLIDLNFKITMKMLELVNNGKMGIPEASDEVRQLVESDTEDYPPIFNLDAEYNYKLSTERAKEISDERD